MKKYFLSIACFLAAFPACCQNSFFSPAPHDRDINCVKILNRDTLVAAGGFLINDTFQVSLAQSIFKTYNPLGLWSVNLDVHGGWIKSVDFTGLQNGIAVGAEGTILTSADGGDNWAAFTAPVHRDFNRIFFIDSLNMIIAGGEPADSVPPHGMQTILKSTDGGQSWSVALDQPGFWLKSVYIPSPTLGFAVGDSGTILKTVNGGTNWTPVSSPIQRDFNSIWFADATHGIIVGGNLKNDSIRTILRTTNGGSTWTINKDESGGWLTDVSFANATTGFAVGDKATVLKTTDGGQTWAQLTVSGTVGNEYFNTVRFDGPDYAYIGGKRGNCFIYNTLPAPEAYTTSFDIIDSTHAVLHGVMNSYNNNGQYRFVISTDPGLASPSLTPVQNVNSGIFLPVQFTKSVSPNTAYFFCLKAWTLGGTVYGDTLSFYTGTPLYEFKTLPAAVYGSSARINGVIKKSFPLPVDLSFEYGTTPSLGSQAAAFPSTVNDSLQHVATAAINSLQPDMNYYFRLKGVTASGTYYGDILNFNTGTPYLSFQTDEATDVSDSSATLHGFLDNFRLPAALSFEYGTSLLLGNEAGATPSFADDTLSYSITSHINNLQPSTQYFFRLKAQAAGGTFYGKTLLFFTGNNNPFSFQTLPAKEVKHTSANLNGYVNHSAASIGVSFEYGLTPSLGTEVTTTPAVIHDTSAYTVIAGISGLQANTVYYYRLKGSENGLEFYGNERTIYTGSPDIPNWDFQNWEQDTVQIPLGWNMLGDGFQRVPGHSGNYALKVYGKTLAMLGFLSNTPFPGAAFHARPDSVSLWLNYSIEPGDTAYMLVVMGKANDTITIVRNSDPITGNSGGVFKKLSFPVSYRSSLTPDSLLIVFIPFNPSNGTNIHPNNYLIVDDIAFTPSAPPFQHSDFENWIQYSFNRLLNWDYFKFIGVDSVSASSVPMVSQTLFSQSSDSDYAAEIRNISMHADFAGRIMDGQIASVSSHIFNNQSPSFPVSIKHRSLNGYYKFFPVNGDSMLIGVQMFHSGQLIAQSVFYQDDSVTEFTPFDLPIVYTYSLTPDSGNIIISCSSGGAKGISRMVIDKLSFDGIASNIPDTTIIDTTAIFTIEEEGIKVYPNPANSQIIIEIANRADEIFYVQLIDLNGRITKEAASTQSRIELDVAPLRAGFYILRLQRNGSLQYRKLIISK